MAFNNINLIHGIGNPVLQLFSASDGIGVVPYEDEDYGLLKIEFPNWVVTGIKFNPESVINNLALGSFREKRYGIRFSCGLDIREISKLNFQKLLSMWNLGDEIGTNYELRLYVHNYNFAAESESARVASEPDNIFFRVRFSDNEFIFNYLSDNLQTKHATILNLIGAERLVKIPERWYAEDGETDSGIIITGV
jgi:RNA recognition motif-containing protein